MLRFLLWWCKTCSPLRKCSRCLWERQCMWRWRLVACWVDTLLLVLQALHASASLGIPVKDNANSGGRLQVRLPAFSDNVGASSVIRCLYTSKQPLALFVQRLAMWACAHAILLACSHIAGKKNVEANAFSRWNKSCPIPYGFGDGAYASL